MNTPHDNAAQFFEALETLGFEPGRMDSPEHRQLERRSTEGNPILRVLVDYEGERQPQSLRVLKLDGRKSQIIEWECSGLSAWMPTPALVAMLQAA